MSCGRELSALLYCWCGWWRGLFWPLWTVLVSSRIFCHAGCAWNTVGGCCGDVMHGRPVVTRAECIECPAIVSGNQMKRVSNTRHVASVSMCMYGCLTGRTENHSCDWYWILILQKFTSLLRTLASRCCCSPYYWLECCSILLKWLIIGE